MGDNGLGLAAGKYFFKNKVQEKYEKKGKEKKRVSRLKNTFFFIIAAMLLFVLGINETWGELIKMLYIIYP